MASIQPNIKAIPGANKLLSQIGSMTAEEITSVLPRDFLVKVQAALAKPRRKGNNRKRVEKGVKGKGGVSKACNSWMCFRTYYQGVFGVMVQAEASGYLRELWKSEGQKEQWTTVAAAYSTIRDTIGKSAAPLGSYLECVCPFVGMIEPGEYLKRMGWEVQWFGQQRILKQGAIEKVEGRATTEREIVEQCVRAGYIGLNTPNFKLLQIALSRPGFKVRQVKELCAEVAQQDPVTFVARALGIPAEHPFLAISTSETEKLELDDGEDFLAMLEAEGIVGDPKPKYEWSGNIGGLFGVKETALSFDLIQEPVDVSDAMGFDDGLLEGGAVEELFEESAGKFDLWAIRVSLTLGVLDDEDILPADYNFWDSF